MRTSFEDRVSVLRPSTKIWTHSLIFLVLILTALIVYVGLRVTNPITGQHQYIFMSHQEEIAIGLQTAPDMIAQFDGLDPDVLAQEFLVKTGARVVTQSVAAQADYPFVFHLLADMKTMNAFALPGGQIFVTRALYDHLQNEDQLAAVLAHEIAHVISRHAAEQSAEKQITQALSETIYRQTLNSRLSSGKIPFAVTFFFSQLVTSGMARQDEIQADQLALTLLEQAGYEPTAMLDVMLILQSSTGDPAAPDVFNSHPLPSERISQLMKIKNINDQQLLK